MGKWAHLSSFFIEESYLLTITVVVIVATAAASTATTFKDFYDLTKISTFRTRTSFNVQL